MTDSPFIDDEDMPYPHNPIRHLPRLNKRAESEVFRFDEGHAFRLAEWCGGTVGVEGSAHVVVTGGTPSTTARIGEYVVETYGNEGPQWYVTVGAELYTLVWWPKGYVPDWESRCYQPWDQPQPDPTPPNPPNLVSEDFPFVHNPIEHLPWLDDTKEAQVFQNRPLTAEALAEWCGGYTAIEDGQRVVHVPGGLVAHLSDFVVYEDAEYRIEPADGFNGRYWPVGRDPGWTHRCYMEWEE